MAIFVHVYGDAIKTPVNPQEQPQGTQLVLVSESGRDIPFTAGKTVTNDLARMTARFARSRTRPEE